MKSKQYTEMDLLIHIGKMLKEDRERTKTENADIIEQQSRILDSIAELIGRVTRLEDSVALTRVDTLFIKDHLGIKREA